MLSVEGNSPGTTGSSGLSGFSDSFGCSGYSTGGLTGFSGIISSFSHEKSTLVHNTKQNNFVFIMFRDFIPQLMG